MASKREKNVVEGRASQRDVIEVDSRCIEAAKCLQHRPCPTRDRHRDAALILVCRGRPAGQTSKSRRGAGQLAHIVNHDLDPIASDLIFQGIGRSLGDDLAVVNHNDVVSKLVRFIEVLSRQQDRCAIVHELLDHSPQFKSRTRIQTGGWFIQENDGWLGYQTRSKVESATHSTGVRLQWPIGCIG